METIVKICGITTPATMDAALEAGADMVGLMRFAPSPRHVATDRAAALAARARGRARIVLVTVDMQDNELDSTVAAIRPDLIQFHGGESVDRVRAAVARTGCGAFKAIGVAAAGDLAAAERYADVCDTLLLDAKPPKDATRPGGHGTTFDWSLMAGYRPAFPYLLSGGLDPDNVAEALAATGAPGVDVSSGVERAPGDKDPARIRAFVAAVRAAPRHHTESLAS